MLLIELHSRIKSCALVLLSVYVGRALGLKKVNVHHLSTCTTEMTGRKIFAYEE